MLTTHDLADIEKLCRRLLVIDHGRVVHDGTIEALHARYGSRRRVVVELEEPLAVPPVVPGATLVTVSPQHLEYDLTGATAGELLARLAGLAVRDVSIVEPDIEDVVARLYTGAPVTDAP
jgi:ABC-2 type transport system ATP-binding protein